MRKIEFRGLNTSGEWVYGSYVSYYEGHHEIHCKIDPEDDFNGYPVNGGTVGQYTGLKDCNGVKIFEGDRIAALDIVCKVRFEDGAFVISIGNFHRIKISSQYLIDNGFSVIGSIHEKA